MEKTYFEGDIWGEQDDRIAVPFHVPDIVRSKNKGDEDGEQYEVNCERDPSRPRGRAIACEIKIIHAQVNPV